MNEPPFEVRDIVRLRTGKSPIRVLEIEYATSMNPRKEGWYIQFEYLSSSSRFDVSSKWRKAEDFILYEKQRKVKPVAQLYQTLGDNPRFGTFLTKNSYGKIVLEMKGKDGNVEAFDPSELEEVMPYTVALTRYQGGEKDGETRHYEFEKGLLSEGDVLIHLSSGSLYKVTKTDTKQRSPHKTKNGFFKLEGHTLA